MDKEKAKIKQLVVKSYSGVATKTFSLFPSAFSKQAGGSVILTMN
ncbi:MAG: hypothetical protein H6Q93_427 [Nitrospirae bacterium]|nr:hypothetical protein [Nitrospirota bacterium]